MKTHKLNIAILACTFGLTACVGTAETNQEKLGKVSPSTYASALSPNGDVDCDAIDNALLQYGIDPAQLEPQVVYEACLDSGEVSEDACEQVAFTCFGEQDECADGHDHGQNDGDGENGDSENDPMCQALADQAAAAGIDLDNMTEDEVFWKCIDGGFDEATCHDIIDRCLSESDPQDSPNDPNEDGADKPDENDDHSDADNPDEPKEEGGMDADNPDEPKEEGGMDDGSNTGDATCDAIRDAAEQSGVQTPISEDEKDAVFQECLDQGYGEQDCVHIVECLTQP